MNIGEIEKLIKNEYKSEKVKQIYSFKCFYVLFSSILHEDMKVRL